MSVTSVDLPEPDTPVTATNRPSGNSTVRSRRLCWRAPMTASLRSGSGVRRAAEGEVFQADVAEEAEAIVHLLEDRPGDLGVPAPGRAAVPAQRDALEELQRVRHRQVHDIADALAVEQHRQALRTQPLA